MLLLSRMLVTRSRTCASFSRRRSSALSSETSIAIEAIRKREPSEPSGFTTTLSILNTEALASLPFLPCSLPSSGVAAAAGLAERAATTRGATTKSPSAKPAPAATTTTPSSTGRASPLPAGLAAGVAVAPPSAGARGAGPAVFGLFGVSGRGAPGGGGGGGGAQPPHSHGRTLRAGG